MKNFILICIGMTLFISCGKDNKSSTPPVLSGVPNGQYQQQANTYSGRLQRARHGSYQVDLSFGGGQGLQVSTSSSSGYVYLLQIHQAGLVLLSGQPHIIQNLENLYNSRQLEVTVTSAQGIMYPGHYQSGTTPVLQVTSVSGPAVYNPTNPNLNPNPNNPINQQRLCGSITFDYSYQGSIQFIMWTSSSQRVQIAGADNTTSARLQEFFFSGYTIARNVCVTVLSTTGYEGQTMVTNLSSNN